MKAPDKIYVAESLIKTTYGNEWSPTPYVSRENTEYIRKDALLEWVKLAYGKVSMNPFDCSEAFDELFYKIESL